MPTTDPITTIVNATLAIQQIAPRPAAELPWVRLDRFPIAIGGGPTCQLRISGPGVRPLHGLIVNTNEGIAIRRWGAETLLNGESFTQSLLAPGDKITCGPVTLQIVLADQQPTRGGVKGAATKPPAGEVAWPVETSVAERAPLVDCPPSTYPCPEPTSSSGASEALRLAESCHQLEDELAETRSLLTSLGAELLQARELAAQQVAKLTSRIDELEGALVERDNLLRLLQEALEHRTESIDHTAGTDTESTSDCHTESVSPPVDTAEPEASEPPLHEEPNGAPTKEPFALQADSSLVSPCGPDEANLEAPSTPFATDLACDGVPAETQSAEPQPRKDDWFGTLDSQTVEPQAEESVGQLANDSVWSPPIDPPAADPPCRPEDLWDIEKIPAAEGSSLWGATPEIGAEREAEASQIGGNLAPNEASEPEGGKTSPFSLVWPVAEPTEAVNLTEEATLEASTPAADPWSSSSLWSTDESASAMPSAPSPADDQSPSIRLSHPQPVEEPAEEAAHEPASRSEGEAEEAPGFASSEPDYQTVGDQVAETLGQGEGERACQPKDSAPVSFIEKYRHLLEEDEEAPPPPSPIKAEVPSHSPSATADELEDDSIEAYMAKMMARLRGESAGETSVPKPSPTVPPVATEVSEVPVAPPQKASPLQSLEELKSAEAPERHHDMSALRSLANDSARHAIDVATSRQFVQQAQQKLLLSVCALSVGGYLLWAAKGQLSQQLAGGLIALAVAVFWTYRAYTLWASSRCSSIKPIAERDETPAAPPAGKLPIDVSSYLST